MSWGRRRGGGGDWGGWPRYVPVAERRAKALKQAEKLRKKGQPLAPVVIAGRTIAATFWGKAWCENLERYGDYENRIPRGRAYVRNGSVVDLKIGAARVDALVSGSHLYSVEIEIRPLKAAVWKGVKGACMGRIGSLLELLQGKLSREVMEIVTKSQTGLFPEPAEISFRCSCPDWASMCKHVAATLYGVGARLDLEPELLFKLRGVDHRELIAAPGAVHLAASPGMRDKMIAEEDLAGIFGIEIDKGPAALRQSPATPKRGRKASSPMERGEQVTPHHGRRPKPAIGDSGTQEAPSKARRGRPPLVRKEISIPQQERTPSIVIEKPEARPKRGRQPIPAAPTETPVTAKRRRGRTSKPAISAETPEPVKRKRGRPRFVQMAEAADKRVIPFPERPKWGRRPKPPVPMEMPEPAKRKRGHLRLVSKAESAGGAAPLLEEPKRERPRLRPSFIKALREETARKRREEEVIRPRNKAVHKRSGTGRDATPASAPIPTRRRGRPPGKRKA